MATIFKAKLEPVKQMDKEFTYKTKLHIVEILKIISNMEKESNLAIYMNLEDIISKVKSKKEHWFSKINKNISIVASLKTINIMDMALLSMMLENMKVDFNMAKKMGSESSHGLMDPILKVDIKMMKNKVKENFTIKKAPW